MRRRRKPLLSLNLSNMGSSNIQRAHFSLIGTRQTERTFAQGAELNRLQTDKLFDLSLFRSLHYSQRRQETPRHLKTCKN